MTWTDSVPPGAVLILGAFLTPLLRGRARAAWLVVLPLASLAHLLAARGGMPTELQFFGQSLVPVRIDALSFAFGLVFHFAVLLGVVYALHVQRAAEHVAALVYAGAAIGAVFAGDLITLFVFWEMTAFASVFLVWAARGERAYRSGMRYLVVQVGSGVILLAGVLLHLRATGSIAFEAFELATPGARLILLAFGIKAAFPLLHSWMQDAYPEATPSGTVFLGAFTTKMAIYALARGFPGLEPLIWIGVAMTIFPVVYGLLENDLRRVLAWSLNDQLGFMVVAVGVGTPLALNGATAHAFSHVLYKSLLFMTLGAVLHRTGTAKATELGGLARSMPWTAACCVVGSASIAAVPLFCGFVSKSLILAAVGAAHHEAAFVLLLFAASAVVIVPALKVPLAAFWGERCSPPVAEAPWNMRVAMGLTATACVVIGLFPTLLFGLLPYPDDTLPPYTASHVVTQTQLLLFGSLGFVLLRRLGLFAPQRPGVLLDVDWVYRRLLPATLVPLLAAFTAVQLKTLHVLYARLDRLLSGLYRHHGPEGVMARTWLTGSALLWVIALLVVALVAYYR